MSGSQTLLCDFPTKVSGPTASVNNQRVRALAAYPSPPDSPARTSRVPHGGEGAGLARGTGAEVSVHGLRATTTSSSSRLALESETDELGSQWPFRSGKAVDSDAIDVPWFERYELSDIQLDPPDATALRHRRTIRYPRPTGVSV